MVVIKSIIVRNPVSGEDEIHPEIPFSEFPAGPREARPDEDGKLAWYVDCGPDAGE